MAGKRVVDGAIVLNVTRNLVRQHVNLRSRQLDKWAKTSSFGKAAKNQTDRVALTVRAANALAQRLSGSHSSTYTLRSSSPQDQRITPSQGNTGTRESGEDATEGLNQDHHFERSDTNATLKSAKEGPIKVPQEQAITYPTPDGSIPRKYSHIRSPKPRLDSDGNPEGLKHVPVKEKLAPDDLSFQPASYNKWSIPSPESSSTPSSQNAEAATDTEQIPEYINTDVFHSPRAAEILNEKPQASPATEDLAIRGAKHALVDESGLQEGLDQDIFNLRPSESLKGSSNDTGKTEETATSLHNRSSQPIRISTPDVDNDIEKPRIEV